MPNTSYSTGVRRVSAASFFTTFPAIENPLSQGGIWYSRDPNQTVCKVAANGAFGTQTGGGSFDDSLAHMYGFGTNYEITGTIYKAGGGANWDNQEVELLVRWADDLATRSTAYGDTTSNGYEWNVAYGGAYQNLGRWKAAALYQGDGTVDPVPDFVPANGDRMRMRIEGQRIRCYWNDVLKIDVTDNDAALKITTGNPGIGFYINPGAGGAPANTNFGFRSIAIVGL